MTSDYGGRKRLAKPVPLGRLAILVGVVLFVAVFGWSFLHHRKQAVADWRTWAVAGPPCPPITRARMTALQLRPAQEDEFDGVRFDRAYGDIDCQVLHGDAGAGLGTFPGCAFTSPHVLAVFTHAGEFDFFPGPGKPAIVLVQHDRASCVIGSKPPS